MNSIGQSLINYGISEFSEANHQDLIKKILMDINAPAQLDLAIEHRDLNSLRLWEDRKAKKYPFWTSSTWKIAEYSLGFALHFMLLKQLIILMFLIAGASILPLYLNYKGDYFPESETQSVLDFFTIGNIYGTRPNSTESQNSSKMDKNYEYYWKADAGYSSFFLLCVFIFFIYSYISVFSNIEKKSRISDYAVEVKGLPRRDVEIEELQKHFEKYGKVVEVFIGRRFGEFLPLYTKKAMIAEQKMIREALINFKGENPDKDKDLKKLKKNLAKCEKEITKKGGVCKHEDLEIKRAYIVFDDADDKTRCLKIYNKRNCCGCKQRKKKLRFRKFHLTVMQSKEPSDIIWENMEIGKCSRFFRRLFSLLVTICLLALSIAMIYYVKTAQSRLPSEESCLEYLENETGSSSDSEARLCFCQNLSNEELIKKADKCYVYIELVSYTWGIKFLSAFGIMLVNFFLKTIMRKLSDFEKPRSRSKIQIRVFKKILLVIFINTAILTYLVNLSIPQFTKYVLSGEYDDFTREWYLRVGSYILTLMLVSLFSPHIIYLILAYPIGACRRKCCYKSRKTQFELNNLFTGPEFDIASRTAQILNVVFTCFLYSGGIPLLNIICFVFLIVIFYTDKWLVLRHFKKPPRYDHTLYSSAMKVLPLIVILHCSVSLYTYGNPEIFSIESQRIDFLFKIFPDYIAERIQRSSGIANCIIILSTIALIILLAFLDLIIKCCLKKKIGSMTNRKRFTEIKSEIEKTNLASYDIRKNPNYAMIINEMDNSVGLRHANSIGYFEKDRLAGSISKESRANMIKETNVKPEKDLDDRSSHDESQPDLSRDDQAEVNLDLKSIRSPVLPIKYDDSSSDQSDSSSSQSFGAKKKHSESSEEKQESDSDKE